MCIRDRCQVLVVLPGDAGRHGDAGPRGPYRGHRLQVRPGQAREGVDPAQGQRPRPAVRRVHALVSI
eukprot:5744644-Prymnesium_polylepis.1